MTPVYATTQQAAAYTGTPPGTIRRWVHEGKLRRYGPKHRALYDLNDVVELVHLQTRAANANLSSVGDLSPEVDLSPGTNSPPSSGTGGVLHGRERSNAAR